MNKTGQSAPRHLGLTMQTDQGRKMVQRIGQILTKFNSKMQNPSAKFRIKAIPVGESNAQKFNKI